VTYTSNNVSGEILGRPSSKPKRDCLVLNLVTDSQDPALNAIRALTAGKSPSELLPIREEIRAHIRAIERLPGEDRRLARHRKELTYLDALLA
jgi:hypothetical protein